MKTLFTMVVVATAVLAGCTWLDGGPSVYDSFDAESLSEGGLGIGGVVITGGKREADNQEAGLADVMRGEIIDARQDIKITSRGNIERALGREAYGALIEAYRRHGPLDGVALLEVAEALGERLRYLVFVRVERDSLSTSMRPGHDPAGGERQSTDYITHRDIGATFHLYDLMVPRLLWTVYLEAGADRTLTRRKHAEIAGTLPTSLYPDPIELDAVAVYLFDDFVARLPGRRTAAAQGD